MWDGGGRLLRAGPGERMLVWGGPTSAFQQCHLFLPSHWAPGFGDRFTLAHSGR